MRGAQRLDASPDEVVVDVFDLHPVMLIALGELLDFLSVNLLLGLSNAGEL